MGKKTINKYSAAPKDISDAISSSVRVKDFLPPPEKLILNEKTQKVTINLSMKSIKFFKYAAKEYDVPYQHMIKEILDIYTDKYQH